MKILRILKKDSDNAVVYLDNEEKLFLSFETIIRNGLKKDDEISDTLSENLIKENRKYFIKQAAFRFLSRRIHSIKELKLKLILKKYDKILVDEIINWLIQNNYLDDYKFSLEFVDEKKKKKIGRNKIKSELFNRGVDREIISEVLSESFSGEDDFKNAFQLGTKKINQLKKRNLPEEKIEQKVITFLLGKGFEYDIIRSAVDKIIK